VETTLPAASNNLIPIKKKITKPVAWWDTFLTQKRRNLFSARHTYQKISNQSQRDRKKVEYRKIRNQYIREVRKDKTRSWEKFVSKETNEIHGE
jgi:hypothetical protein